VGQASIRAPSAAPRAFEPSRVKTKNSLTYDVLFSQTQSTVNEDGEDEKKGFLSSSCWFLFGVQRSHSFEHIRSERSLQTKEKTTGRFADLRVCVSHRFCIFLLFIIMPFIFSSICSLTNIKPLLIGPKRPNSESLTKNDVICESHTVSFFNRSSPGFTVVPSIFSSNCYLPHPKSLINRP